MIPLRDLGARHLVAAALLGFVLGAFVVGSLGSVTRGSGSPLADIGRVDGVDGHVSAVVETPAPTSGTTIFQFPQPSALPRSSASTSMNRDPLNVNVPIQSTRRASGSRDSRSFAIVSALRPLRLGAAVDLRLHDGSCVPRPTKPLPSTLASFPLTFPSISVPLVTLSTTSRTPPPRPPRGR